MRVRRLAALMMPTLGPVFSLVRKRSPATARAQMRMMRKSPTPTPSTLADSLSSIPLSVTEDKYLHSPAFPAW